MNCHRNDPSGLRRGRLNGALSGALVMALAACAEPPVPVMAPPPPPPPPVMAPPPPPPPPTSARVPPPPVYRIASGSPTVLARFPRGTQVTLQTVICLKAGEQVTISGSNGQTVTYNRRGCLRRSGNPTPENSGGFTFGWIAPGGAAIAHAVK